MGACDCDMCAPGMVGEIENLEVARSVGFAQDLGRRLRRVAEESVGEGPRG